MSADRWLLAQDLYRASDPGFVAALRSVSDAEALAAFAADWYADPGPFARQALIAYLELPLNAFRHEPLVKRLLKLAEAAGDDEALAALMVTLDRALERQSRARLTMLSRVVPTEPEARQLEAKWRAEGLDFVNSWRDAGGGYRVVGGRPEYGLGVVHGSTMPRDTPIDAFVPDPVTGRWGRRQVPEWVLRLNLAFRPGFHLDQVRLEDHAERLAGFRLFSVRTRQYLRRRVWRSFRRLGRSSPDRYVTAMVAALARYQDVDFGDGIALLDRWALVHVLFHHSEVLAARPGGWRLAEGRSIDELRPAPMYPAAWADRPEALLDLLERAGSQPVRQWVLRLLKREPDRVRSLLTPERLLGLLGHHDPDVVAQAADWLRQSPAIATLDPDRWLALLGIENPDALAILCDLAARSLAGARLSLEQVVGLAVRRPLPVARLGLELLKGRPPGDPAERAVLLGLIEAACTPLRPELLRLARSRLAETGAASEAVLEFLDSRHADARAVGLDWMHAEPRFHDDLELWRRLLESPHDDIRVAVLGELERHARSGPTDWSLRPELDSEALRRLWAGVLLNVHCGSRSKPVALAQLVRRLERRPAEVEALLPVLSVALRSTRGPEWRSGLAAIVGLAERRPDLRPRLERAFPDLTLPAVRS